MRKKGVRNGKEKYGPNPKEKEKAVLRCINKVKGFAQTKICHTEKREEKKTERETQLTGKSALHNSRNPRTK